MTLASSSLLFIPGSSNKTQSKKNLSSVLFVILTLLNAILKSAHFQYLLGRGGLELKVCPEAAAVQPWEPMQRWRNESISQVFPGLHTAAVAHKHNDDDGGDDDGDDDHD